MKRFAVVFFALALLVPTLRAASSKVRKVGRPVPNSYVVVLTTDTVDDVDVIADDLRKEHKIKPVHAYRHVLHGFSMDATALQAEAVSRDPRVKFVEEDNEVQLAVATYARSWNQDRSDGRLNPRLDTFYSYCSTGKGVRIYIVDTGVWRDHDEFSNPNPITGGRRVVQGYDYLHDVNPVNYPNESDNPCPLSREVGNMAGSHGTAVASVAAGRTLGIAPDAIIVPVRTNNCSNGGSTTAILIKGLDWIPTDPGYSGAGRVVNMSMVVQEGVLQHDSTYADVSALEESIQRLLNQGVTVVVAAGNQNEAIGTKWSPARFAPVITVGGTKGRNVSDIDSRWNDGPPGNLGSNYGTAIDIWAPADRVTVAHYSSTTAIRDPNDNRYSSGTSFAAPLVAGAAARLLQLNLWMTNADVLARLTSDATTDAHGLNLLDRQDSPNRLLYIPTNCRVHP